MDQLNIFIKTAFYNDTIGLDAVSSTTALERYSELNENQFLEITRMESDILSDDSIRLIHRIFDSSWGRQEQVQRPHIMQPIVKAAKKMLEIRGDRIAVKYDYMFHWRELTRFLGEDLFVTARLAANNCFSTFDTHRFSQYLRYEPGLRNNDVHLLDLFKIEEIYDIHCHLNASAKVFDINWVCLMNHPAQRLPDFRRLTAQYPMGDRDAIWLNKVTVTAAQLRLWLYNVISGEHTSHDTKALSMLNDFLSDPLLLKVNSLESMLDAIRYPAYEKNSTNTFRADYILPADYNEKDGDFLVYLGEREFLYQCWSIMLSHRDYLMEGAFRYYLLAKNLVRRYMVQLNSNHGFSNFQRYENVKALFLKRHPDYMRMLSSLAVAGAAKDSGLRGIELRIAPVAPIRKLRAKLKYTVDSVNMGKKCLERRDRIPECNYVYHFIKKRDDTSIEKDSKDVFPSSPRNINVRRDVKHQALAIAHMCEIENDPLLCTGLPKIKGIDAASSEFNCRPEVFAQAFRFLKSFGLKATYHAGEDFYDIADGLRAIDEAITYLGLSAGDRLGHALALGIDAKNYYSRHSNQIVVKKQWFLDNVVWLHCRARDWNIRIEPETEQWLEKQFRLLFNEIFVCDDSDRSMAVMDMETYHLSMLLRGDNPMNYRESLEFNPESLYPKKDWHRYSLTPGRTLDNARHNENIVKLYRLYHLDRHIRVKGRGVMEFKVCPGYAHLITQMQEALMDRVEKHDLCIECCPSSNLVIGSLGRFQNHPIFRFYNINPNKGRHMAVTINTDDLGVFHTTLLNEYTYLALALTKQKDEEGHRIYPPHMIATWLRNIAAFSRKYRF